MKHSGQGRDRGKTSLKKPYCKPQLTQFEPGSQGYERVRAAFADVASDQSQR